MTEPGPAPERQSIAGLLKRLGDEFVALIRSELRLASGEVSANLAEAIGGLIAIGVGVVLVMAAMLCLLGAIVAFVSQFVGLVAAALIVAAVTMILGGIAIFVGAARLKATDLAPRRAVANLRRDVGTLKGD